MTGKASKQHNTAVRGGSEILRCAQDDRAVLPAALWPSRADVRLRLMCIRADKSAVGTINRPLLSFPYTYFIHQDQNDPLTNWQNQLYFI